MISTIVSVLFIGLLLYVIFFVAGKFLQGPIMNFIGVILGLIFLLYALRGVGVVSF
jgi:hypothetical protein